MPQAEKNQTYHGNRSLLERSHRSINAHLKRRKNQKGGSRQITLSTKKEIDEGGERARWRNLGWGKEKPRTWGEKVDRLKKRFERILKRQTVFQTILTKKTKGAPGARKAAVGINFPSGLQKAARETDARGGNEEGRKGIGREGKNIFYM